MPETRGPLFKEGLKGECAVSQEQDPDFAADYKEGKRQLGRFDLLRLIAAVFDSNFLAARRLRQRHLNLEHSIFEPVGYLFSVSPLRERQSTLKSAVGSFTVVGFLFFNFVRLFTLALDRESVIDQFDAGVRGI